jgi:hypothetical protein
MADRRATRTLASSVEYNQNVAADPTPIDPRERQANRLRILAESTHAFAER